MKECCICKSYKSLDNFNLNKRSLDGLQYSCKACNAVKDKARYLKARSDGRIAQYKLDNREKISIANIEYQRMYRSSGRKQARKLEMCQYKGGLCKLCGLTATLKTIPAFDFHHLDSSTKVYNPSDMVNMRWERITHELDKCELLCSNCHRILHADNTVPSLLTEEGVTTIETMYEVCTEGSRVGYKLLIPEAESTTAVL